MEISSDLPSAESTNQPLRMDNPEPIQQPDLASATPPTSPDNQTPPPTYLFEPIILQVGSERFTTTIDTPSRSLVLKARLKLKKYLKPKHQVDGSYFLDANPEICKHVLRFMRHGIYPLAYDSVNGHDLGLYAATSRLADRLQVEKLSVWLKERQYLKVVQIQTSTRIAQEEDVESHE
ncbi:MAG: hypothetical protein Q9194_005053 [Teloschistes cf. exilis]